MRTGEGAGAGAGGGGDAGWRGGVVVEVGSLRVVREVLRLAP